MVPSRDSPSASWPPIPSDVRGRRLAREGDLLLNSSNASGDHGLSGDLERSGDGALRRMPMPCNEDITSSIASRKGDGVLPSIAGDVGVGDGPLEKVG